MAENSMFLATLVEMGFQQKQSELALSKTGNSSIQSAMDWILANPDWESQLPGASSSDPTDPESEPGSSEGPADPEAIPVVPATPLTDEEKAERAKALQDRLNKARDKRLEEEKKDKIEREKSRRKEGRELGDIKSDYQAKLMKKQADERRREKAADAAAKKRVQEQIAADKAARIARSNAAKATAAVAETSPLVLEQQEEKRKQEIAKRPTPTNTRIQFRLPDGKRLVQVFEADENLSNLIRYAHQNTGLPEESFRLVSGGMPPTKFTDSDRDKTLVELSLVPSAVVMVQKI